MSFEELLNLLKSTMDASECELANGIKSIEIDKKAKEIVFNLQENVNEEV